MRGACAQRYFPGTLLRLPLRTPAQSGTSQLCKQVYTIDSLRRFLRQLTSDGALDALNLRYLQTIEVSLCVPPPARLVTAG
jgi:hypothetical protein